MILPESLRLIFNPFGSVSGRRSGGAEAVYQSRVRAIHREANYRSARLDNNSRIGRKTLEPYSRSRSSHAEKRIACAKKTGHWTRRFARGADALPAGADDGLRGIAGLRANGYCHWHGGGSAKAAGHRRYWRHPVFHRAHPARAAAALLSGLPERRNGRNYSDKTCITEASDLTTDTLINGLRGVFSC